MITLQNNAPTEVYFSDTDPNHIVFNNPTDSALYVSTSPNVSPSSYEMLVASGGTKMYARMMGLKQIYLYHSGDIIQTIRVTSFEETFSPQSVAQTSEVVNVQQMTGEMNVVSLPALPNGGNKIGSVDANLVGDLVSEIGLKVDLQGGTINISQANIGDMQMKTAVFAFQTDQANASEGNPLTVAAYKTLTVEIVGTATASLVRFFGLLTSGTKIPLRGVNLSDLSNEVETSGMNQLWSFDITGLDQVMMEIVSTNGTISINGKVVA